MTTKRKKPYTGRDYNMVNIIKGATKSYVEKDHKKEANKKASRGKVDTEEDHDDRRCIQCNFPYDRHRRGNISKEDAEARECGYCSVSCMDYATG